MLDKLDKTFDHSVYQIDKDGKVTLVTDKLFSRDEIMKAVSSGKVKFLTVFLETGLEAKSLFLRRRLELVNREKKTAEIQLICTKRLLNRIEKCELNNESICSERASAKLKSHIAKAKEEYNQMLDEEVYDPNLFYNNNFIINNHQLLQQYKDEKKACFKQVLDKLQPSHDESLTANIKQNAVTLKDILEKNCTRHQQQIEHHKSKFEALNQTYSKTQAQRVVVAKELLQDQSYKEYHPYLQQLINNTLVINIPTSYILKDDLSILQITLRSSAPKESLVSILIERGADPIALETEHKAPSQNNTTNSTASETQKPSADKAQDAKVNPISALELAAGSYSNTKCKSSTTAANIFKLIVNAFSADNPRFLLHYHAIDKLEDKSDVDSIFKEIKIILHSSVKLFYDNEDLDLIGIRKATLAIEKNLVDRVQKFVMLYHAFLSALEYHDTYKMLAAIEAANIQICVTSKDNLSCTTMHRKSKLVMALNALKTKYLGDGSIINAQTIQQQIARSSDFATTTQLILKQQTLSFDKELVAQAKSFEEKISTQKDTIKEAQSRLKEADAKAQSLSRQLDHSLDIKSRYAKLIKSLRTENQTLTVLLDTVQARSTIDEDTDDEIERDCERATTSNPPKPGM